MSGNVALESMVWRPPSFNKQTNIMLCEKRRRLFAALSQGAIIRNQQHDQVNPRLLKHPASVFCERQASSLEGWLQLQLCETYSSAFLKSKHALVLDKYRLAGVIICYAPRAEHIMNINCYWQPIIILLMLLSPQQVQSAGAGRESKIHLAGKTRQSGEETLASHSCLHHFI